MVSSPFYEESLVVESFNMTEAANALGMAYVSMMRRIEADLMPLPCLREVEGRKLDVYSKGELETIARILHKHTSAGGRMPLGEEHAKHDMHQHIQAYRSTYV